MDITPLLLNAQSNDQNQRKTALEALEQAQLQSLPVFLACLVTELANESKPAEARQLAGLLLKNAIQSKDEEKKKILERQWIELDIATKNAIKNQVVQTLESNTREARQTAAQVCARIAAIDLPLQQWNDLLPMLLQCVLHNPKHDGHKEACLTCIGYICEESTTDNLQQHSNEILTAVVQGMRKEETNQQIRLAACKAMYNSLEFVKANMEKETERNFIMSQLCEATKATEVSIREAAMQCLVKIVMFYYEKLKPYIQALFGVTIEAIKNDEEIVGRQGLEFWSSICEEELDLIQEGKGCEYYAKGALQPLIEVITQCLVKQNEINFDEWNLAAAAGSCLALLAQTVENDVTPHIVPFITTNINNPNWRYREAAILAFGSILDGPKAEVLEPMADQAVPMLITHVNDSHLLVQDTAIWTLGRVAELQPQPIINKYLQQVLETMLRTLENPEPRIAAKACWCLLNIFKYWEDEEEQQSYPLTPYFQTLVQALLKTIDRDDAGMDSLRTSAYESLNELLSSCANDCIELVKQLIPVLLTRLEKTLAMESTTGTERQEQTTVQGLLCGALQVSARKLGDQVVPFADSMMTLFLRVFATHSSTVQEESLMAVGAIASALGKDFEKYMMHFSPFLFMGLKNFQAYQVCNIAVGVVNDIAAALKMQIVPYCDEIMTVLLEDLRAMELDRSVKPVILGCFGDIALNIGMAFEKYLQVVMAVMEQASNIPVQEGDEEMKDYKNTLRQTICESYTGIMQGFKNQKPEIFLPYVNQVLQLVHSISVDENIDEEVFRCAIGVIGDLANVYGKTVAHCLQEDYIKKMVMMAVNSTNDEQLMEAGQWTAQQMTAALA